MTPSPSSDVPASAADRQFVTFSVAGEMFAVPMAPVQEIIRVPEVARLPLAPPALDGLANLRGRVLPIMNLRRLFGTATRHHDDATRALVIHLGQPLGFVVDRVASVLSVEPDEVQPAQAVQSVVRADYLTGVINRPAADGQRQLLLVLDFQRLVDEQFAALRQLAAAGPAAAGAAGTGAAAPASQAAAPTDELRLVSFTVAAQEYAIAIAHVQEIVQLPDEVTAVPNAPAHVLGLISLRRRLLPLVSLRGLFGLPALPPDEHHRIVVVALPGGAPVGLVTDAVKEVLSVPRSQADPMPGVLAHDGTLQELEAICRLDAGRRLVSIIAADRLLGGTALRDAADLAAAAGAGGIPAQEAAMADTPGARSAAPQDEDRQVVIFRLGAEEFGVPIMSVQEIVRVPEVLTRVPQTPPWVEGVINLRGTVLPVIDQRARLGLPGVARNDRQRIMVYTLNGQRTGFVVDSVAEVLRVARGQVAPAPALGDEPGRLISEVARLDDGRRLVMLIDPSQLLGAREARALGRAAARGADALAAAGTATDAATAHPGPALARAA